jgi:hypothetical protein
MVSVQLVDKLLPSSGPGRRSMKTKILKDAVFKRVAHEEGILAAHKIATINTQGRTKSWNAQIVWKKYKKLLTETAYARERASIPKVTKCILDLEKDVDRVQMDMKRTEHECMKESAILNNKIQDIETSRHAKARDTMATLNWVEGEVISHSWIQQNKEIKPRDMLYALRKQNENKSNTSNNTYERDSQHMANMARDYHKKL